MHNYEPKTLELQGCGFLASEWLKAAFWSRSGWINVRTTSRELLQDSSSQHIHRCCLSALSDRTNLWYLGKGCEVQRCSSQHGSGRLGASDLIITMMDLSWATPTAALPPTAQSAGTINAALMDQHVNGSLVCRSGLVSLSFHKDLVQAEGWT